MANYPEWVLKFKKKGTAIHKIGNNYYLYEIGSIWDPKLKRARKVTKRYLGRITEDGIIPPKPKNQITKFPKDIKEYGISHLLLEENSDILNLLKEYFPYWYKELFIISSIRFIHKSPLKNIHIHYEDSFLSVALKGARVSSKSIHNLLWEIGGNRSNIAAFLRRFMDISIYNNNDSDKKNNEKNEKNKNNENNRNNKNEENNETAKDEKCKDNPLLIDLTHIFSYSNKLILSEKGYNNKLQFMPQVNLLFIFSLFHRLPMYYRVLPGNIRDVSTIKNTIIESRLRDVVVISDKGFYSKGNIELLKKESLKFIIPLRRNSKLIDYDEIFSKIGSSKKAFKGYFDFNGRYIWYTYKDTEDGRVYLFFDESLKVKETRDYLTRIKTHPELGYTIENFHEKEKRFGTLAILTNLDKERYSAYDIFKYFKARANIEVMFDIFKNVIYEDKTYAQDERMIEGWMFIGFLSLIYYYRMYILLLRNNLLKRYSVSDFILYLQKIRKMKIDDKWITLETPKKTMILLDKLGIKIKD